MNFNALKLFYKFNKNNRERSRPYTGGKDGKPDSWFLFDSNKRKQNPVTEVQEPIPKISHILQQGIKYCTKTLKNIYLCNILSVSTEIMSKTSNFNDQ